MLTTPHALTFNRFGAATAYARAYLRYRMGLRGRPTRPPGLSIETVDAVKLLVTALLKEH